VAAKEMAVEKCVVARKIAMHPAAGRGVRRHWNNSCILVISRLKIAVGR
jgi:hypothetical protein